MGKFLIYPALLCALVLSGCGCVMEKTTTTAEDTTVATEVETTGFIPEETKLDEESIAKYEADFAISQQNGDYVGMNKAMHLIENTKRAFYGEDYSENFDYTHNHLLAEYPYYNKAGQAVGMVYIFSFSPADTNAQKEAIADSMSLGETDYAVIDYRYMSDANMQVRNSYLVEDSEARSGIIDALLLYESQNETSWNRTKLAMEREWEMHNLSYLAGYDVQRAMHVDFNNKDEANYNF